MIDVSPLRVPAPAASAVRVPPTTFVATCDLVAHVRGRALPGRATAGAYDVGWVPADLALTSLGGIVDSPVSGSAGDLRLRPVESAAALVPAAGDSPAVRLVLADTVQLDGTPWPGCPRRVLTTALADLRARHGLRVVASFEHEFVLPGVEGPPFSWQRARAAEPFGGDLLDLLEAAGLEPETWLPEYGAEQFEVTLAPAEGALSADRAVLLRELVRDLARRRGRPVTFAPVLTPAGVGNGVHVHLSLLDDHGRPALADTAEPAMLSALGRRFAGGILGHAPALLALSASHPASYLRLQPHRWSSAAPVLARGDREALLRLCEPASSSAASPERQLNLEFRAADATANPWIVLGSLVRAGLDGLDGQVGPAELVDVGTDVSAHPLGATLPRSLAAALEALETDTTATGWLPEPLRSTFLAVKRHEVEALSGRSDDEMCEAVRRAY